MKAGWQTKLIGDVCHFATGGTPSSTVAEYYANGTINWVVSGDVHKKQIWECEKKITELGMKNSNAKMLPKDSVLIALNGQGKTRGTVAMLRVPATCNQSIVCMSPKDRGALLPEYLFFYLDGLYKQIRDITGDKDRRGLNMPILRGIEIPIAPVTEQQRIVTILDQVFEGIAAATANAEKNLTNARELFQRELESIFSAKGDGWNSVTIGEISKIKGGKRVPKGYKLLTTPTPFPYLRVTDFSDDGTINMDDLRYVDSSVQSQIKNYIITSKDLYISIAGTIGKSGIVPDELDGANLTENACRLVFGSGISNKFVYYFTKTNDFVEQAGLNTRTAAQPKLALSRLASIELGIPQLNEQIRLVGKFEELSVETKKLETIYKQKLTALEQLKKSILHQAFTGQLS